MAAFRVDVDTLAAQTLAYGAHSTHIVSTATLLQDAMLRASCMGIAANADHFAQLHFELADACQSFCTTPSDLGGKDARVCDGAALGG